MEHLPVHHLHLKVGTLNELFNSLDPSPFFTQELDRAADQHIERWARRYPANSQLHLSVHLEQAPSDTGQAAHLSRALREHYALTRQSARAELSDLLWQGRLSLLIGSAFVTICILLADFLRSQGTGPTTAIFREGLTIIGWVALWRPVQIFLYDWWPTWRRVQVLSNLKRMRIELLVNNVSITHQGGCRPDT
ncbi:hypothetical protein [Pseudoduganella sp. OTU4001]|uniref:hypothetical protein n=1 Tax=Pseudoduganella sp. OTU4001 TaxID=3043854 RepID=UPI00313E026E